MTAYIGVGRVKGPEPCGEKRPPTRERDIMFLAMVAAPARYHALSGNAYDRRFDVAASRRRGVCARRNLRGAD